MHRLRGWILCESNCFSPCPPPLPVGKIFPPSRHVVSSCAPVLFESIEMIFFLLKVNFLSRIGYSIWSISRSYHIILMYLGNHLKQISVWYKNNCIILVYGYHIIESTYNDWRLVNFLFRFWQSFVHMLHRLSLSFFCNLNLELKTLLKWNEDFKWWT